MTAKKTTDRTARPTVESILAGHPLVGDDYAREGAAAAMRTLPPGAAQDALLAFALGHRLAVIETMSAARAAAQAELAGAASPAPDDHDATCSAVAAERERIKSILALDEAKGRKASALHLALAGLGPAEAASALSGLPIEGGEAAPPPRRHIEHRDALVIFDPTADRLAGYGPDAAAHRRQAAWGRAIDAANRGQGDASR